MNTVKSTPPKKSKAARMTEDDKNGGGDATSDLNGSVDDAPEEDDKNVYFKDEILEGKRKRFTPVSELTLNNWLAKNFTEKDDVFLSSSDMYREYLDECSTVSSGAVELNQFKKAVTTMFPRGLVLSEGTQYADLIKQKKKTEKKPKPEGESLQHKMKDLIKEAIVDLGNPRKGIKFGTIRNHIAGKYPALQVADKRANAFKSTIVREVYFKHIECLRGIGACGFYRLPRTAAEEAAEVEAEKKEEERIKKEKNKALPDADEAEKTGEEAAGGEVGVKKDEADDKIDGEKAEAETSKDATDQKKKKKKKSGLKKIRHRSNHKVVHGAPTHVEDTFYLGMTFNCEPKEASVSKIRKYITDFYKQDVSPEKLKKCLETGCGHGYWSLMSGTSGSGTFQLTMQEFDPTADDDLTGMITNALVACTEPKVSSAALLKKYIIEYHPDFKVAERPAKFLHAIDRATANEQIVRLTGIGGTGSFKLAKSFTPSPLILQGKDTSSDYEDDDDDGGSIVGGAVDVDQFRDAYVPRPTKRHGRPNATHIDRVDPSAKNPRNTSRGGSSVAGKKRKATAAVEKRGGKKGRGAKKDESSDEEEEEEESDEEVVAPSKSRGQPVNRKPVIKGNKKSTVANGRKSSKNNNKKQATGGKKSVKISPSKRARNSSPEEEEEDDEGEMVEYTPRKSVSRGGGGGGRGTATSASKKKTPAVSKASPKKKAKVDSSDEEEEDADDAPEYTPKKSTSRGGGGGGRKVIVDTPKSAKGKKKVAARKPTIIHSTTTPVKGKKATQKSKKGRNNQANKKGGKTLAKADVEEISDDSDAEEEIAKPVGRSSTKAGKGKDNSSAAADNRSSLGQVSAVVVAPVPTKGAKKEVKKTGRGRTRGK